MRELHRRWGRTDLEADAAITAGDEWFAARTKNISTGGVFVATPRVSPIGDHVSLTFRLPAAAEPIATQAEVRWIRESPSPENGGRAAGMGLRFVDAPLTALSAIQEFLRANAKPGTDEGGQ